MRRAGVSRKVFYAHFHNRREVLLAGQTLYFEQMIGAVASALFNSTIPWPQQIWDGCAAVTRCVARSPALGSATLLESYALGPEGVRRADDSIAAWSLFFEEGRQQRPEAKDVPALICEAIFTAVREVTADYLRHGRASEVPGLLPVFARVSLTPFIGREATWQLIEGRLAAAQANKDG